MRRARAAAVSLFPVPPRKVAAFNLRCLRAVEDHAARMQCSTFARRRAAGVVGIMKGMTRSAALCAMVSLTLPRKAARAPVRLYHLEQEGERASRCFPSVYLESQAFVLSSSLR